MRVDDPEELGDAEDEAVKVEVELDDGVELLEAEPDDVCVRVEVPEDDGVGLPEAELDDV